MGCELCQNENRENLECKLSTEDQRPIELKNKYDEENYLETYYSSLEEKLNEKYSISPKILEDLKEKIKSTNENNLTNKNRDEYSKKNSNEYIINTFNVFSNTTIQLSSRNKKNNEENKIIESDTNQNGVIIDKDNIYEAG
jgi:hypothetical protein